MTIGRIGVVAFATAVLLPSFAGAQDEQWPTFNGDPMAQKYTTASEISPENVHRLAPAWTLHTGDVSKGGKGSRIAKTAWSATPLFVNNTVYVGTPYPRVYALEPDTGKVKWIYDAQADFSRIRIVKSRGVAYWRDSKLAPHQPCQKRLYVGTEEGKIHSIDADTGKRCVMFADGGILDINRWNTINAKWILSARQPPAVVGDTLVIGWGGEDLSYQASPPGTVFGVDARSGKLKWTFQIIPETLRKKVGTANVWAAMSVDPKAGLVYLPISSPEANFYGGDRKAPMPYASSVTALEAETGRVVWSRQLVHHDIWDFDTNSPPTLVDIPQSGKTVPALVQATKQGFLFVLNRMTGEPLYPVHERKVPRSDVPGEEAAATQPFVDTPEPTVGDRFPGIWPLADIASFGWCSRTYAKLRDEGRYTPPSLQGSISYPGKVGGVQWGGGAVDPITATYVVNSSNVAHIIRLVPRADYNRALEKGLKEGAPQRGTPYGVVAVPFLNPLGMPCWKPPFGTLSSYDLKTGKLLWRKTFGAVQQWGFYMPESWGSVTIGGPVITKTGLIFIGASMDSRVRAIDLKTGRVLWRSSVQAPAVSIPAIYTYKNREYVLFTAGGNPTLMPKVGDQLIAYALKK